MRLDLAGACDCHTHVIGPRSEYPLIAARAYTPMQASAEALRSMLAKFGVDRVVIVQPSFYGTDNRCTLDGIATLGENARGVAVLAGDTSVAELDDLHHRGVRGLRVNVATGGRSLPLDAVQNGLREAAELCARNGWHLQTFIPSAAIAPLAPLFAALPVPMVIDHFGLIAPGEENREAADALRRLLQGGRTWVKLSAAYRITAAPWTAMRPLARLLAAENPDRVVWGSDWPHTPGGKAGPAREREEPFQDVDAAVLLDRALAWFPDPDMRRKLFVENPATLYDF